MRKLKAVRLNEEERRVCRGILCRGKGSTHRMRHGSILRLDDRIPNSGFPGDQVTAWYSGRTTRKILFQWHFTTEEAHVKFSQLYRQSLN